MRINLLVDPFEVAERSSARIHHAYLPTTKGEPMIDTCQLDAAAPQEAIDLRDALVQYKQTSGRMFPTCSEVLEVIRELGYEHPGVTEAEGGQDCEFNESTENMEEIAEPETAAI
jgi:hypothetical protein